MKSLSMKVARRKKRIRIARPPPPKTTVAAGLMLVGGTALLLLGAFIGILEDAHKGMSLMILGVILVLPGSYASYILYGAYKRWPDFHYHQVPSYDE
mmetsp:Transcript_6221/g.7716  ORF Transcript_6221/g.7716 Transcript_6221/m.7716 type:complete len:97 (-) Transcript_6221:333-623(-)